LEEKWGKKIAGRNTPLIFCVRGSSYGARFGSIHYELDGTHYRSIPIPPHCGRSKPSARGCFLWAGSVCPFAWNPKPNTANSGSNPLYPIPTHHPHTLTSSWWIKNPSKPVKSQNHPCTGLFGAAERLGLGCRTLSSHKSHSPTNSCNKQPTHPIITGILTSATAPTPHWGSGVDIDK
jgi:hypothetical protein